MFFRKSGDFLKIFFFNSNFGKILIFKESLNLGPKTSNFHISARPRTKEMPVQHEECAEKKNQS
jgi:hypothetical protein